MKNIEQMLPNEWLNDSRPKILDNWKISEETQNWVDWVKVAVFLSEKILRNPTGTPRRIDLNLMWILRR